MQSAPFSLLRKRKQRGMTFIGMLLTAVIVGSLLIFAAKTIPSLVEYQAIRNAVNRASDQLTVADIERAFEASADIDDITSITGKDLEVTKINDRIVIKFAYDKEIQLIGPVSLLIHYSGQTRGMGGV